MSDLEVKTNVKSSSPNLNVSNLIFKNSSQTEESDISSTDSKNCSSINSTENSQNKNVPKKEFNREMKKTLLTNARIIPSRYKQAASEASRKAILANESTLSNSGGSFEKSRRTKRLRSRNETAASMCNLTQMESSFCASNRNLFKPKTGKDNRKLHSTALNSTFFERTHLNSGDSFSTTVVGGQKGFHPSHGSNTMESLSELPDISQICPVTTKATSIPQITVISVSSDKEDDDDVFEDGHKDYSTEEISAEYLRYLTWSYVEAKSEETFKKQVKESEKQISLLTQLIEEEEEERLAEKKKKLQMLDHYEKVSQNHALLTDTFTKLNETVHPCKDALETLSHYLEVQMNHIKLENIYIPSDEASYKESLDDTLRECSGLLESLNVDLKPQTDRLVSFSHLMNNLNEERNDLEPCVAEGERAASLAIQAASLKLTLTSSTDDRTNSSL